MAPKPYSHDGGIPPPEYEDNSATDGMNVMRAPSESSFLAGAREPSGLAVASLVTGILGVTCNSLVLPFIAVACGHLAKKRIRASQGELSGDVFATWGLVLGYIGCIISVIAVFVFCLHIWWVDRLLEAINKQQ